MTTDMNMTNSTNTTTPPDSCVYPDSFWFAGDLLQWTSIRLVAPFYFVLGILGHLICYQAFVRQAKSEKAYNYQIYHIVAEIGEIVTFTLFMLSYQWAGINTLELGSIDGSDWFQRLYAPMFFAAHMAIPMCNAMSVVCLLLSVSMAADRVFAFVRPFVYKNIDHKLHQRTALIVSLAIGFSVTFYNAFLFEVDTVGYPYRIAPNIPYLITQLATVLALVCNATRIVGLSILIACNAALIYLYRRRMANMSQMHQQQQQHTQDATKREAQKKANEKTLTRLTLSQSFFTSIAMFSYSAFYSAAYGVPTFNTCEHRLFAPLLDTVLMLADTANTAATILVNKKTRTLTLRCLRFYKRWKVVRVDQDTGGGGGASSTNANGGGGHGRQSMQTDAAVLSQHRKSHTMTILE